MFAFCSPQQRNFPHYKMLYSAVIGAPTWSEMLQFGGVTKCIQEQGVYLGRCTNPPPIHKVSGALAQLPVCVSSQQGLHLGRSRHTR